MQGIAEYSGLMHRVKKVAFRTRHQSSMAFRVSNRPFFTHNNGYQNLNRLCHMAMLVNENQGCILCLLTNLVHQKRASCTYDVFRYIRYTEKLSTVHFLSYKTIGDRTSGYEKISAPKTAFALQLTS